MPHPFYHTMTVAERITMPQSVCIAVPATVRQIVRTRSREPDCLDAADFDGGHIFYEQSGTGGIIH
jgi:hypothetical protein